MLTSRGLGVVLGDLASMGFDAKWGVLGAADVGANHKRDRIWIVAHSCCKRYNNEKKQIQTRWNTIELRSKNVAHTRCELRNEGNSGKLDADTTKWSTSSIHNQSSRKGCRPTNNWWQIEPNVGRVANGLAAGVDRLKAIGNGQVSEVARRAWEVLGDL